MPTVKRAETYRWTVDHAVAKRAGETEFFSFDVEFKALPQKQVLELVAKAVSGNLPNDTFVTETMAGWHDLKRADGTVLEFSLDGVKELCELYPGMPASLSRAWIDSVTGKAARKN